jgi:hypothetical protein
MVEVRFGMLIGFVLSFLLGRRLGAFYTVA